MRHAPAEDAHPRVPPHPSQPASNSLFRTCFRATKDRCFFDSRSFAAPEAGVATAVTFSVKETLVIPRSQDSYVLRRPQTPLPSLLVGRDLDRAALWRIRCWLRGLFATSSAASFGNLG